VYVEPFAGGAGAALRLLYGEHVDRVVLNDLNPGISAFWHAVFHDTDDLIERVRKCKLSIEAWHGYRAQYLSGDCSDVELGFATLYLNRTNRSGILNARPIGGLQQTGKWKLSVRFNREDLVNRIRILGAYRDRVDIQQQDALHLLTTIDTTEALLYVDPPYIVQGDDLYLDTLTWEDHQRLAKLLKRHHRRWMLTYDTDPRVPDLLYKNLRCAQFSIKHTAAVQQIGTEYAIFSQSLRIDSIDNLSRGNANWLDC
jgi:DNA adenine methylase